LRTLFPLALLAVSRSVRLSLRVPLSVGTLLLLLPLLSALRFVTFFLTAQLRCDGWC
jgi:hypothetical protein